MPLLDRPRRINLLPVHHPDSTLVTKLGLFNVRSLSGKFFLINDLICSYKLDFLLLKLGWTKQVVTSYSTH